MNIGRAVRAGRWNEKKRQDRTGQADRQWTDSIGRTVLQTVSQKLCIISTALDVTEGIINNITGSAVALHCCKAHSEINRKMENSTPCKMVTPENFTLKLGRRNYVEEVTYYTIFDVDRLNGGSPQMGEI